MKEWIDGLNLLSAIAFFWVVGILRTSIIFSLGWAAASGSERWKRLRTAFTHPIYQKAQVVVNKWGVLAVPICFLTLGFQTAVIMTTGFTKMPLIRWIPAMLLGTFIWGLIYGTVGMAVVWAWLERPWSATPLIVLAITTGTIFYLRHRKAERTRALEAVNRSLDERNNDTAYLY